MKVEDGRLDGIKIVTPDVFGDERGWFLESYSGRRYEEITQGLGFVQDNISFSRRGVLRGLHFQNPHAQGKLIHVLDGEVFDVVVDIRSDSPTFGEWEGRMLDSRNKQQLYAPAGFAHGFIVTSEEALFAYKCTDFYTPDHEHVVRWDDPDIGIKWPVDSPTVSDRDCKGLLLRDLPHEALFSVR